MRPQNGSHFVIMIGGMLAYASFTHMNTARSLGTRRLPFCGAVTASARHNKVFHLMRSHRTYRVDITDPTSDMAKAMCPKVDHYSGKAEEVAETRALGAREVASCPVVVDIVYGLNPDSSTGGCVVQRTFENSLRSAGVADIGVHVASSSDSADDVYERLCREQRKREDKEAAGGKARPSVLIVDGIALLFLRDKMKSLGGGEVGRQGTGAGAARGRPLLVAFIHYPFSKPFYCEEPWLRRALPESVLRADARGTSGLAAEEKRLFALCDNIIAVGRPCQSLLTTEYGVLEDAMILLEPTFPVPLSSSVTVPPSVLPPVPDAHGAEHLPIDSADAAAEGRDAAHECTRRSERARVSAPASPLSFVSVGTLCPRKGQLALIAAFRAACAAHPEELGNSVLTLIGGEGGDPAYATRVRATASVNTQEDSGGHFSAAEPSRVRVLGSLPHDQTLERVASSDAFLLNSSVESWAVAPVEAALQGLPVLSTDVGALRESLPPTSCIWVGEPRALEGALGSSSSSSRSSRSKDKSYTIASSADWERALLAFARDRKRFKAKAARAVAGLARRFGVSAAGSRARAVQALLGTAHRFHGGLSSPRRPPQITGLVFQVGQNLAARGPFGTTTQSRPACSAKGSDAAPGLEVGPAVGKFSGRADGEAEWVRRATVMHAFACICGALYASVIGGGRGSAGLRALVAAQVVLLACLAPPPSPANLVTIFRSFIPPLVVWLRADSDFGQVAAADVSVFGLLFVLLDLVDGVLARRSKTGATRVGAALDVESDSIAMLFLSLAASRQAWAGGIIAGVLRYLYVLATGARELPPSPVGPAGRWVAKIAALASVLALVLSVAVADAEAWDLTSGEVELFRALSCALGVSILCASFSVDFYQVWVILPREASVMPGTGMGLQGSGGRCGADASKQKELEPPVDH